MLKNYFKIGWRNLTQHKTYTTINILGLTVGMACCILIALYAREELSYDTFHEKADRIVAVGYGGGTFGKSLSTPYPLADAMEQEIPEVQIATRMTSRSTIRLGLNPDEFVAIERAEYAEEDFFEVFSFRLVSGNEKEALNAPGKIVLTQSASRSLFGNENPVGESLYWLQDDTTTVLQVGGVVEDPPQNSSISFGALISFNTMHENRRRPEAWRSYSHDTYAVLKDAQSIDRLSERFEKLVQNHYENTSTEFFTVPLTSLYLSEVTSNRGFTGNSKYLYLFGSVALFILFIACVNYVNLATARVTIRAKEVGIRKSLGAHRGQVAGQFLGESVLLSIGAYLMSILLAAWLIPYFNQLFGSHLAFSDSFIFIFWLALGAVAVGILAGIYPSLYLSRFSPADILRSRMPSGKSGSLLRKSLVVGQFAIALVLIIGALIIYEQLQFAQTKDLGFDGEQVVVVDMPNRRVWEMRNTVLNNVEGYSGIKEVTVANGTPGSFNVRMGVSPDHLSPQANTRSEDNLLIAPAVVGEKYIEVLDIEVLAGRNFNADLSTDVEKAFIINRQLAKLLGWTPEEAVGKTFNFGIEGTVIGVVENFHIRSLHQEIEPVVLQMHGSDSFYTTGRVIARLNSDRIPETMDRLEQEMARYAPHNPFEYEFLDEKFDAMYRTERRFGQVTALFTFIAIIVACLGLYGLAAFSAERRIKEIGVRKVLGATVTQIVGLLSKDFLKLVMLGFIIAAPVAWYMMNRWLQDFAYRIDIGAGVFLIAGTAALLIALATVSWQSVRAASQNPVESLQRE